MHGNHRLKLNLVGGKRFLGGEGAFFQGAFKIINSVGVWGGRGKQKIFHANENHLRIESEFLTGFGVFFSDSFAFSDEVNTKCLF